MVIHSIPEELLSEGVSDQLHALRNDLAKRGVDIIDCSMINPDLAPPRVVLDKLLESVVKLRNHRYAVARGVRKLREAFAFKYEQAFGIKLDPESEVCVTLGAKDAVLQSTRVMLGEARPKRRGNAPRKPRVLIGTPFYPVHRSAALLAGAEVVTFPLSRDEGQTIANIELAVDKHRPHLLIVNYPNNPLGCTVSRAFWERISLLAERFDFLTINDFVYGELGFAQPRAASIFSSAGAMCHAVEIYSLSKCLSVPGWRVGCVVGSKAIIEKVARLKSHTDYGLFLPFQYAAAFALQAGDSLIEPQRSAYAERAQVIVGGLRRRGWLVDDVQAGAAVWALPPAAIGHLSSQEIARLLLDRYGVMVSPGEIFGVIEPAVRIALVAPPERLRELLTRLEGFSEGVTEHLGQGVPSARFVCESV